MGSHSDRRGPTARKEFPSRRKSAVTGLGGTDVFRMLNLLQPQDEAVANGSGEVNPSNVALSCPTYPVYAPALPQPHHEPKEQTTRPSLEKTEYVPAALAF